MHDERLETGALKFIGKPCPHGHTLRYARTGICVDCHIVHRKRAAQKRDELAAAKAAERITPPKINGTYGDREARSAARGRGDVQYDGKHCGHCGGRRRYTNRGTCVTCKQQKNAASYDKDAASDFDSLL